MIRLISVILCLSIISLLLDYVRGTETLEFANHVPAMASTNTFAQGSNIAQMEDFHVELTAMLSAHRSINLDMAQYAFFQTYPVVMGADFLGVGYDASKSYATYENALQPLFRKTFNSQPEIFNDRSVPANVNIRPIWETLAETKSFLSESQFTESISRRVSAGGSGSFFGCSGGADASYGSGSSKSTSSSSFFTVFEVRLEMYEMTLETSKYDMTEPSFRNAIDWLRKRVEKLVTGVATKSSVSQLVHLYPAFHAFFQQFGTHYVHTATVGGNLFAQATTRKSSEQSKEETEFAASAYFSNMWVKVEGSTSTNSQTQASKFSSNSVITFHCIGGDPLAALMVNQDNKMADAFRYWLTTIKEKPNIARFGVKPISELLPVSDHKLAMLMMLASDLYLARVPPRGNNFFEVSPFRPPVWSSTNTFLVPGRGTVGFYALVRDSFKLQLSAVPQKPLLTITFGVRECTYEIHTMNEQEFKSGSLRGTLDVTVPRGTFQFFRVVLDYGRISVSVSDSQQDSTPVTRQFSQYEDLLKHIRYIGFESNGWWLQHYATTFVGLSVEQVKKSPIVPYETCEDFRVKGQKEDVEYKAKIYGHNVNVFCVGMGNEYETPKMYLKQKSTGTQRTSSLVHVADQNPVRPRFSFVRFYPEHLALDLCDVLPEYVEPRMDGVAAGTIVWSARADAESRGVAQVIDHLKASLVVDDFISFDEYENALHVNGALTMNDIELDADAAPNQVHMTLAVKDKNLRGFGEAWFGSRTLSYAIPGLKKCTPLAVDPHSSGTANQQFIFDEFKAARLKMNSVNMTHIANDLKLASYRDPLPHPMLCSGGQNVFLVPAGDFDRSRVTSKMEKHLESVPGKRALQVDKSTFVNASVLSLVYSVELPSSTSYILSVQGLFFPEEHFKVEKIVFANDQDRKEMCSIQPPKDVNTNKWWKTASCTTMNTFPCGLMTMVMSVHVSHVLSESPIPFGLNLEAVRFTIKILGAIEA